jgi:DNA-binding NtrC family response regulator
MNPDQNHTIFLVDSDRKHGENIKNHLKKYPQYNFQIYTDFQSCLDNLHLKPAVIFLDMELPHPKESEKAGIENLKLLKAKLPEAEVVMFTGSEKTEIALGHVHEGAYDFIEKNSVSHLRAESIILSLFRHHKLKIENVKYQKLSKILFVVIGVLIVLTIILYYTGIVHDRVGGQMF